MFCATNSCKSCIGKTALSQRQFYFTDIIAPIRPNSRSLFLSEAAAFQYQNFAYRGCCGMGSGHHTGVVTSEALIV